MNAERAVRRALWGAFFWRLVGDGFGLIPKLFAVTAAVFQQLSAWARNIEQAIFYMEIDHARRYRLLTGTDLGLAAGDATRYGAIPAEVADARDGQALSHHHYIEPDDGD